MEIKIIIISPDQGCKSPDCLDRQPSAEDSAVCCDHELLKAIKLRYPATRVKFVHTERRLDSWSASVRNWIYNHRGKTPTLLKLWTRRYSNLMGAEFDTEEFYKKYTLHNQFVRKLFRDEPDRLLILNLEDGDPLANMQKLCKHVGLSNSTKV